jgi:hypothetical protein
VRCPDLGQQSDDDLMVAAPLRDEDPGLRRVLAQSSGNPSEFGSVQLPRVRWKEERRENDRHCRPDEGLPQPGEPVGAGVDAGEDQKAGQRDLDVERDAYAQDDPDEQTDREDERDRQHV